MELGSCPKASHLSLLFTFPHLAPQSSFPSFHPGPSRSGQQEPGNSSAVTRLVWVSATGAERTGGQRPPPPRNAHLKTGASGALQKNQGSRDFFFLPSVTPTTSERDTHRTAQRRPGYPGNTGQVKPFSCLSLHFKSCPRIFFSQNKEAAP